MSKYLLMTLLLSLTVPAFANDAPRRHGGQLGELKWEILFTMPQCSHPDEATTWCTRDDAARTNEQAGVLDAMLRAIRSPGTRHVYLASYSLSNDLIVGALCEEAQTRALKVHVYVDKNTFRNSDAVKELRKCSAHVKVVSRGTGFGRGANGYIQHAKMMMASPHEAFLPLSELAAQRPAEAASLGEAPTTFVSTSANLSSVGFGLNFENWTFFEAPFRHRLAQQNLCFFHAMDRMKGSDPDAERVAFGEEFAACQNAISAAAEPGIEFYPVPHAGRYQEAYSALRGMIDGAKTSIKVGVHRLSTNDLAKPLLARHGAGVTIQTLFDDDTLRSSKCKGGPSMPMSANEVAIYRNLHNGGIDVRLMRTNGGTPHMFHDKFVIVDDAQVFVGAGNFTSSSLNVHDVGNFEQFYVLTAPAMVKAYTDAWDSYMKRAVRDEEHAAYGLMNRGVIPDPEAVHPGLLTFDDTPCARED